MTKLQTISELLTKASQLLNEHEHSVDDFDLVRGAGRCEGRVTDYEIGILKDVRLSLMSSTKRISELIRKDNHRKRVDH